MPKIIWRTDVHISDQTPVRRVDNWAATVLRKLTRIGEIAREVEADAVLDGGDMFDQKSPVKVSHRLMRCLIEAHRDYPCPVFANVGNHDCVYGRIDFLPQQPLGVLFSAGVFQRLYDEHVLVLAGPPKVRIVGVPYHGTAYDLSRLDIKREDEDYLVVVAHLLASPQGGTMFEGEDIVSYEVLKSMGADLFFFGHWHQDQGITEILPGKWVVNTGSLTRGSLTQDNLEREPCCVVTTFDTGGIHFERRSVGADPAEAVFALADKEKQEIKSFLIDDFVATVEKELRRETSQRSVRDTVRQMNVPEEVKERALFFLEQVST